MLSLFADKTTIILRKMLKEPEREWVIHDFIKANDKIFGIGQGRVAQVLNEMERLGYLDREKRGARSKSLITNPERLIENWINTYKFEHNKVHSFYSPEKNIHKKITDYLLKTKSNYAFTLHTAANLITSFVKTEDIYFYLKKDDFKNEVLKLRQHLGLLQLVQGGNIHIIEPYYKTSVFFNNQKIKNTTLVSKLQLYLDLYNFQPRGREHAEFLKAILDEKGKHLD